MKVFANKTFACYIATVFSLFYFSCAAAIGQNKTPTTPVPHTQYQLLYTLNASHGVVSLQSKQGNGYQLVLQNVHSRVTYQIEKPRPRSGTISITQLLKLWEKQSATQHDITGDITGVQVDPKIGHAQFYQKVKLFKPHYRADRNELTFNIIFTQPDKPTNALEEMENATLFINGCELCECRADKITCD